MGSNLDALELTQDAFLGGKVQLWQPLAGYRAGVDPVLLAASVPAKAGQSVLDLGCGVGAAALCLGARVSGLSLFGVERQAAYVQLARRNGLDCVAADIGDLPADLRQMSFDHVICNPPYFDRTAGYAADDPGREGAMGEDTPLGTWIDIAARRLRPKGYLHLIHRADRLPELLSFAQDRLGSLEVLPLAPRIGRAAELVILRARKEGRAQFRLHAPEIIHSAPKHEADVEDYNPRISSVLRNGNALIW